MAASEDEQGQGVVTRRREEDAHDGEDGVREPARGDGDATAEAEPADAGADTGERTEGEAAGAVTEVTKVTEATEVAAAGGAGGSGGEAEAGAAAEAGEVDDADEFDEGDEADEEGEEQRRGMTPRRARRVRMATSAAVMLVVGAALVVRLRSAPSLLIVAAYGLALILSGIAIGLSSQGRTRVATAVLASGFLVVALAEQTVPAPD